MTQLLANPSLRASLPTTACRHDLAVARYLGLPFMMGLTLPLISVDTYFRMPWLGDRMAVVDVVTLLTCIVFATRGLLRFSLGGLAYILSLLLALAVGISYCSGPWERSETLVAFSALAMAMVYFMVGFSIIRHPSLVRALLMGMIAGVMWESLIVVHDYFLPGAQWFPDTAEFRVRGTFRASGQLGAYAFSCAAIGFTFASKMVRDHRVRQGLILAACLAVFMIVAASRRSAMFSVAGGVALYLVIESRRLHTRRFIVPCMVFVSIALVAILRMDLLSDTFLGQRVQSALMHLQTQDSFDHVQFSNAMQCFWEWFPLGLGPGRSTTISRHEHFAFEMHNGHLSLLVELGVLGWISFYLLGWKVLQRSFTQVLAGTPHVFYTLVFTVLVTGCVFMIHNRLHRDRGFMLFLGLVSAPVALAATRHGGGPGNQEKSGQGARRRHASSGS